MKKKIRLKKKNNSISLTPPNFSKGKGFNSFPLGRLGGVLLFIISFSLPSFAQMEDYDYQREIKGISEQWHTIILPEDVFGHVQNDLDDIRILGVNGEKEIIEAPYIFNEPYEVTSLITHEAKFLNESKNSSGYFFTYEMDKAAIINEFNLSIGQDNFDWRIKLEGSQEQKEWFTIVEDYRILGIKNNQTDFKFSDIHFPDSKYKYYRIQFNSKEKPVINHSSLITETKGKENKEITYRPKGINIINDKDKKTTEYVIDFGKPISLNHIDIAVIDKIDYYRPTTIQYLRDSTETDKGWNYHYAFLTSDMLNSINSDGFNLKNTILQKLKIIIKNYDNTPLEIRSITAQGRQYELSARFTEKADYFLVYGNKKAKAPNYDIAYFKENIPEEIEALSLGEATEIQKETEPKVSPLFESKLWLWGIMILIILVLGYFTLKMMKSKK